MPISLLHHNPSEPASPVSQSRTLHGSEPASPLSQFSDPFDPSTLLSDLAEIDDGPAEVTLEQIADYALLQVNAYLKYKAEIRRKLIIEKAANSVGTNLVRQICHLSCQLMIKSSNHLELFGKINVIARKFDEMLSYLVKDDDSRNLVKLVIDHHLARFYTIKEPFAELALKAAKARQAIIFTLIKSSVTLFEAEDIFRLADRLIAVE